jgi:hypothetical protein
MSTLIAHNPKFDSKLTTLGRAAAALRPATAWGAPPSRSPRLLVDALLGEVERRGYTTQRTQLALGAHGAALFGILDLVPTQAALLGGDHERILSLGFRNATDQSLAIQGVAGAHVLVCDNLALSGDTFAFKAQEHHRAESASRSFRARRLSAGRAMTDVCDTTLEAAAPICGGIPPEAFQVGGGEFKLSAVQLVLQFAQQALKTASPPNRLPQGRRVGGSEIDGYRCRHVAQHIAHRDR